VFGGLVLATILRKDTSGRATDNSAGSFMPNLGDAARLGVFMVSIGMEPS